MTVEFDVVMVAFASADALARVLPELVGSDGVGDVVVVDHGEDGSAAIAAGLGAQAVVDPTNPGYGAGQNRGLALTKRPYVLLLNPDADVQLDGIRAGLGVLESRDDLAAVQGVIVNALTGEAERSQGRELGPVHLLARAVGLRRLLRTAIGRRLASSLAVTRDHVERVPTATKEVESLSATVLLCRRTALLEVGGFDPRYFLYGEDLDLCRRLRGRGWKLAAVPFTFASHVSGGSSDGWWNREFEWWRGTMTFAARWWPTRNLVVALVAAFLRATLLVAKRPRAATRVFRALLTEPIAQHRSRRVV